MTLREDLRKAILRTGRKHRGKAVQMDRPRDIGIPIDRFVRGQKITFAEVRESNFKKSIGKPTYLELGVSTHSKDDVPYFAKREWEKNHDSEDEIIEKATYIHTTFYDHKPYHPSGKYFLFMQFKSWCVPGIERLVGKPIHTDAFGDNIYYYYKPFNLRKDNLLNYATKHGWEIKK